MTEQEQFEAMAKWMTEFKEAEAARCPRDGEIWTRSYAKSLPKPEKLARVEVVEIEESPGVHFSWWGIKWRNLETGNIQSEIIRTFKGAFDPPEGYPKPPKFEESE